VLATPEGVCLMPLEKSLQCLRGQVEEPAVNDVLLALQGTGAVGIVLTGGDNLLGMTVLMDPDRSFDIHRRRSALLRAHNKLAARIAFDTSMSTEARNAEFHELQATWRASERNLRRTMTLDVMEMSARFLHAPQVGWATARQRRMWSNARFPPPAENQARKLKDADTCRCLRNKLHASTAGRMTFSPCNTL
jgi:hypothetical protein